MAAYSARRCGAAYTVTNSSYNCEQRYFHIVSLYTHNEEGKKMKLDYPQKANGMFIIKGPDFDDIATMFLSEYQPQALHSPCPLDIDQLVENALYIAVKDVNITSTGSILGMMAFASSEINVLDTLYRPAKMKLDEGTMLLDRSLLAQNMTARRRFTKAHEASHWILHRTYHSPTNDTYYFRRATPHIACRSSSMERYSYSDSRNWSDSDWEEWQADRMAASLLMPKEPFQDAAKYFLRHSGISRAYLVKGRDVAASREAIENIANLFQVSKKAVQIRLKQLGLLFEPDKDRILFSAYL